MPGSRFRSRLLVTILLPVALGAPGAAGEEGSGDAARPHKSVYGTLLGVNDTSNTVMMKSEDGENLAWRFEAEVIKEAKGFATGAPLIVIYRMLPGGVKRVTALAFPGAEKAPTYVNMTGSRVVLRSAPAVDGSCEATAGARPDAATESMIPEGGRAEVLEACWCCAASGETCSTTTKSGVGRAYLVQCFQ